MKKYTWTFILLSSFNTIDLYGQVKGIFTKAVKCEATIIKSNKDTVYVITPDSCSYPLFDTAFNGTYLFKKTPSQKITAICSFKNKKLDGQEINFYESGQISEQGFNYKGRRHGKWTYYYRTGEVSFIGNYKRRKTKSEKYFDKTGKEINSLEYFRHYNED